MFPPSQGCVVRSAPSDFFGILDVFIKNQVDFIVIGGVSAVLHGAPITTFDLDIVHSREPDNIQRLLKALKELDAHYRTRKDRKIEPDESHLSTKGHHLLMTNKGPLDILGTVGSGVGYHELLHSSELMELDEQKIWVQSLQGLIDLKREINREKDRRTLPILQGALDELNEKDKEP